MTGTKYLIDPLHKPSHHEDQKGERTRGSEERA